MSRPLEAGPGIRPHAAELHAALRAFMDEHVLPAEPRYAQELAAGGDPHRLPPVVQELKALARERGLWNLFLPDERWGAGLTNVEYAHLAELTGHSPDLGPEALNCSAPDTGNMELLAQFGSEMQQERWLEPLLDGRIRSCFAMTEPAVASSDASNIATTIRREGDEYVVHGRKWFISGAADARCTIAIAMGVSDPDAPRHARHSMVLVPLDTPGVEVIRNMEVFGYTDQHGHVEMRFDGVRVPAANLLGEQGGGFAIAQARLGPGRIHHCMRAIGMAERSLAALVARVAQRSAFGGPLAEQGVIQEWIATSRIEITQARLLVLETARLIDTVGARAARTEIAAIKVVAARVACAIADRAIQAFGAAGVSQDTPLARFYAYARTLRLADGPDEVHLRTIARHELAAHARAAAGAGGAGAGGSPAAVAAGTSVGAPGAPGSPGSARPGAAAA